MQTLIPPVSAEFVQIWTKRRNALVPLQERGLTNSAVKQYN